MYHVYVRRLARLVTLNEMSYENQGSWLTPTGVNPLPVAYSQFTFAFEEVWTRNRGQNYGQNGSKWPQFCGIFPVRVRL
jgi:hypothetical protein